MSVLNKIAYLQGRRDEEPNEILAKELADTHDKEGIREIAVNLWNKDKNIQSDCIGVLYGIGYLQPELITEYVFDLLKLLKSKSNRLVWGGMLALSTITEIKSKEIYENLDDIYSAMDKGSVITVDNGVKILSKLASKSAEYNNSIFPYLINHIQTCRPKDIPQHSESILISVNAKNRNEFLSVLREREHQLTSSQLKRIKRIYKMLDNM